MNNERYARITRFYRSVYQVRQNYCWARNCGWMDKCDWYNSPLDKANYVDVGYCQVLIDNTRNVWCSLLVDDIVRPVMAKLTKLNEGDCSLIREMENE